MKTTVALFALVAALSATTARALPDTVLYAARVENDVGPFTGTVSATFQLFDRATGGTELWSESVASVVVLGGDFVHDLGSVEALDDSLINRDTLFLQVTMNGDLLEPRASIAAVPFALRARDAQFADRSANADRLGGLLPSAFQTTVAQNGGLSLTGNALSIAPNAIGSANIVDGAVSTNDLADGAVKAAKLDAGAVGSAAIAANAITSDKIADGSITANDLIGGSVTSVKIATGAVGTTAIADNSISSADIGANAVGQSELQNDAVTRSHIVGTEVAIREGLAVCGTDGELTLSVTCRTLPCGLGGTFLTCTGSCSRSSSAVCDLPTRGFLLAP